jgi:hypothetical protein
VTIAIRHAWLQKHPSPSAESGEFHWHPADRDRDLRASCVERMRGIEPPAVLWQIEPGRVAWAQLFAAIAPVDHRNYVGVVLTIAEDGAASTAELVEAIAVQPAQPWSAEVDGNVGVPVRGRTVGANGAALDAMVARALLSGGAAAVEDPASAALPAQIAMIERAMPAAVTFAIRRGVWRTRRGAQTSDPVAELVVAAVRDPSSHAATAWRLLGELAEARGVSIDDIAARVGRPDDELHAALTDAERAALGGPRGFVETLHAWGRGRLDRCADIGTVVQRFADLVALRMLARLVMGRDAADAIAEARWYALLPASRRMALMTAIAARTATLRVLVEQNHA